MHVPAGASHRSHGPAHALAQQYPSAHCPEKHSLPPRHSAPFPFFATHAPALHAYPAAQSPSVPQLPGHVPLVPEHTYGVHDGSPALPPTTETHVPACAAQPSQLPLHSRLQQYPSTHCPLTHSRHGAAAQSPAPHVSPTDRCGAHVPPAAQ